MIFLDANVPMYIVGADHPHKLHAQDLTGRLVREEQSMTTSSEVFQEILHRFLKIERRDRIELAFETLRGLVDVVLAVDEHDVFAAKDLVHAHPRLSARDALHVAVMRRHGVKRIASFDRGFDAIGGIGRLPAA